jgi:hypothetical protein
MPDIWFVFGLALGVVVTGFCAVGSFERGADSVRRAPWRVELSERKRAVVASRAMAPALDQVAVPVLARTPLATRASRREEQARQRRAQRPVFIPYGERDDARISL